MSHEIDQDRKGTKKILNFCRFQIYLENFPVMTLKKLSQNLIFLYFWCAPFTKISNTLAKNYKKIDIRIGWDLACGWDLA